MSEATTLHGTEHEGMAAAGGETHAAAGGESELVAAPGSRRMRWAQWWAVTRGEVSRQILRRRAIGAMGLALLPVLMFGAWALFSSEFGDVSVGDSRLMFAAIYQGFILNLVIFFGSVVIFSTLVRREMRDRTLHYHFLSPVRRELLLAGKFAGGVITAWVLFGLATLASYALCFAPFLSLAPVELEAFFLDGPGFSHAGSYLLVTALATLGYGAVFVFLAMFFKNPVLPALGVFGWEAANFLLPPALKKLSVIHYLVSLLPVPVPEGPFALLSEIPPPWIAVPGLLVLSAVLIGLAAWRFRSQEILYGED